MTLETLIQNTTISFTDKIFVHGAKEQYPEFCQCYPPTWLHRTLYVACKDRPYTTIMQSVYQGLTNTKTEFWQIPKQDRKTLYKLYIDNKDNINQNQYWKPWWEQ